MFSVEVKSRIGEDICILVKMANHPWNYICECGDAMDLTVKEVQNANAVFISHTHIDHFVNFDAIIRHQIGIQRKVVVCGPKGIARQVQSKILGYTWNLINADAITYEIREVVADNKIKVFQIQPPLWEIQELGEQENNLLFEEKDFQVTGVLLDHKIPTLAYKFKQSDTVKIDIANSGFKGGKWVKDLKEAFEAKDDLKEIEVEGKVYSSKDLFHLLHVQKGNQVGIIMDHAASPENHQRIIEHFGGADTVYIESFYQNEDQPQAEANFHSYAEKSGEIMRLANVKEAVPVHFSRRYGEDDINRLKMEFDTALKG